LEHITATANAITPFTADGELDEVAFRAHLGRIVDAGLGIYLASPGSGDVHALSLVEFERICTVAVEVGCGRAPVFSMTPELHGIDETLTFARAAASAGVDEVQLWQYMGGHGIVPRRDEQLAYWREVLGALDHPAALSIHGYAGYLAEAGMLAELCEEFDTIKTVSFHQASLAQVLAYRDALPERVRVGGSLERGVPEMLLGVTLLNCSPANVIPRTSARIVEGYLKGDMAMAAESTERLERLVAALKPWSKPNSRCLKMALRVLGLPGGDGTLRRPLSFPPKEEFDAMAQRLERLGVAEWEAA
jgi:4-hydroxy-tetrahydrodipicolinate synthase